MRRKAEALSIQAAFEAGASWQFRAIFRADVHCGFLHAANLLPCIKQKRAIAAPLLLPLQDGCPARPIGHSMPTADEYVFEHLCAR